MQAQHRELEAFRSNGHHLARQFCIIAHVYESTRLYASFVEGSSPTLVSIAPFLPSSFFFLPYESLGMMMEFIDDDVFRFHLFPRPKGSKNAVLSRPERESWRFPILVPSNLVLYILLSLLSCARAARAEYQTLDWALFSFPSRIFDFYSSYSCVFLTLACFFRINFYFQYASHSVCNRSHSIFLFW